MKITVTFDLETDYLLNSDKKSSKNISAMQWAVDNCPLIHLAPMIDNKFLIDKILDKYNGGLLSEKN